MTEVLQPISLIIVVLAMVPALAHRGRVERRPGGLEDASRSLGVLARGESRARIRQLHGPCIRRLALAENTSGR